MVGSWRVAMRSDDQQVLESARSQHVFEQPHRRPFRPVEVVEHEEGRHAFGDRRVQIDHSLERPVPVTCRPTCADPGRWRSELGGGRRLTSRHGPRGGQQTREVGPDLVGQQLGEAILAERVQHGLERLDEGLEGRLDVLRRSPVEHECAPGGSRTGELTDQSGLPDPGFALDQHHATLTAGGRGPGIGQDRPGVGVRRTDVRGERELRWQRHSHDRTCWRHPRHQHVGSGVADDRLEHRARRFRGEQMDDLADEDLPGLCPIAQGSGAGEGRRSFRRATLDVAAVDARGSTVPSCHRGTATSCHTPTTAATASAALGNPAAQPPGTAKGA